MRLLTGAVRRLCTTQLFTYFVTNSHVSRLPVTLFAFYEMIDLPHFWVGTLKNGAYDPEI